MTTQEIIAATKQLIAIPSSANEPEGRAHAIAFIADMLSKHDGITIERFESNGVPSFLAYTSEQRPDQFDVLFNAHVDTVPAAPHELKPYIKDNKLYGRGVYDMKLAAVALTDLFIRHAFTSPLSLGLQIVADEEVGGFNGAKIQTEAGVSAKFAIFGEMTDLEICNETRGICWAEVTFKGISAHGGYAWDGKNAVTHASDFARRIVELFPMPAQKTWTTTANIAAITTDNTIYNRVPDSAAVKIDFRFTPEDERFKDEQTVAEFLRSVDANVTDVVIQAYDQAVNVPANNADLARFMDAFAVVVGKKPTLIKRYGSSDTRFMARRGTACIEFGPTGANLHADNEYVDLASVEPFYQVVEQFLLSMAAHKRAGQAAQHSLVEESLSRH